MHSQCQKGNASLTSGYDDEVSIQSATVSELEAVIRESLDFLPLLDLDLSIDNQLGRSDVDVVSLFADHVVSSGSEIIELKTENDPSPRRPSSTS